MAISRPITRSTARNIVQLSKICQAIRFNGANNYGQLATRAIDPDGDNVFEFWTPSTASVGVTILSQNVTGAFNSREFQLYTDPNPMRLRLLIGGLVNNFGNITLDESLLYRVEIAGGTISLIKNGVVINSGALARGAAREPLAATKIGVRTDGVGNVGFFSGLIPYIRINGTYWAMDAVGQAIQPSLPAGNDMTLFNTVPEQWEQISCGLRPQVPTSDGFLDNGTLFDNSELFNSGELYA